METHATAEQLVLDTIHTGLTVSSLDDAIAFWCDVIGCQA